jgi:hypothetical protein
MDPNQPALVIGKSEASRQIFEQEDDKPDRRSILACCTQSDKPKPQSDLLRRDTLQTQRSK